VVRHLVERLRSGGIEMVFCGLKKQVLDVIERTGLAELIGRDRIYPHEDQALAAIYGWLGPDGGGELLRAPAPGATGAAR
jgi:SulP family sulfate permease